VWGVYVPERDTEISKNTSQSKTHTHTHTPDSQPGLSGGGPLVVNCSHCALCDQVEPVQIGGGWTKPKV
jgi:hypothetical protein